MAGLISSTNRLINITDPPKDLDEDGFDHERLSSLVGEKKTLLASYIRDVFHGVDDQRGFNEFLLTNGYPIPFKPVSSDKTFIVGKITLLYNLYFGDTNKRLIINRIKKSDGADLRPSDLCVSYDAGPGPDKLVRNHKLVVTPGTVLDPATKPQPRNGIDFVYLPTINGSYQTLPDERITELSLNNIINGPITITKRARGYQVIVPTNTLGNVSGTFDEDYSVETEETNVFAGNPRKNQYIYNKLFSPANPSTDEIIKIKQYLLAKELGDTLQVQWLNHILTENESKPAEIPQKSNTVMATNDTIVWLRCINNGIGVIFNQWNPTLKEYESVYYLPNIVGEVQELLAKKAFIATIRDLVYSSNLSVIKQVEELLVATRNVPTPLTILDSIFTAANIRNLQFLIENLRDKLRTFNEDLKNELSILTNVDVAKETAKNGYLTLPFIKNKSGVFKKKISVRYLLPERKQLGVSIARLTNVNITGKTDDELRQLIYSGGKRYKQKGGACRFDLYEENKNALERIINQQGYREGTFDTYANNFRTCRLDLLSKSTYKTNIQNNDIVGAILDFISDDRVKEDAIGNILELPRETTRAVVLNTYINEDLRGDRINDSQVTLYQNDYRRKFEDNDTARSGQLNANNFLYIFTSSSFKELIFYGAIMKKTFQLYLWERSRTRIAYYYYGSYPIPDKYNLYWQGIRGRNYFQNNFTYYKIDRTERLVITEAFNRQLFDETVELLAYAKYYCFDLNTNVLTNEIRAFYNVLRDRDARFDLTNKYDTIVGALDGVDIAPYQNANVLQLGGEISTSLKNKKESSSNFFDMFNEIALELHDYYHDQEHYRCMTDTKDYSSFIAYKTSALEGVKTYIEQKDLNPYQQLKAEFLGHVFQEDLQESIKEIKFNFSKIPRSKKTKLTQKISRIKPSRNLVEMNKYSKKMPLANLLEMNEYSAPMQWRENLEIPRTVRVSGGKLSRYSKKTKKNGRRMRLKSRRKS